MSDIGVQLLSFGAAGQQAKMADKEGRLAAEMEGVAALQRETDRKEELVKAISSQRARAGASGIQGNIGSPLSVINQMVEEEKTDTERDKFNAAIAAQSARYRGASRAASIRTGASLSLLKAGVEKAQSAGIIK